MSRDEAIALYLTGKEVTVEALMKLAAENEKLKKELERLKSKQRATGQKKIDMSTPSGMTATFAKQSSRKKRRKRRGRKKGHPGAHRAMPARIDEVKEHTLKHYQTHYCSY